MLKSQLQDAVDATQSPLQLLRVYATALQTISSRFTPCKCRPINRSLNPCAYCSMQQSCSSQQRQEVQDHRVRSERETQKMSLSGKCDCITPSLQSCKVDSSQNRHGHCAFAQIFELFPSYCCYSLHRPLRRSARTSQHQTLPSARLAMLGCQT